ncbi:GTPase ObgE [Blattabacterium cuenoti]|uniref:GTPase Obg n=1 Tax=Blattabacterium cuenoti STAT TaxID=1457030 RepID=A0A224AKJ9_9FLAO|nr:GTPase ObgE [Blattabacterium cuenoti]BBA17339.1 GTP-binding protein [Blattabacterium cuenoti STAT]
MKNCFIDFIRIYCKSGDGGTGCVHFYRDRRVIRGGPDGGSGGKGGDIILQGNSNIRTFLHLRYHKHWIAKSGFPGKKNNITGENGKDLLIEVPVGTVVKDEKKNIIMEITKDFQKNILFEGGKGGKGNAFFKNSIVQSPQYAQPGIKTKGFWIFLELKILADVGFVGFPNTGKSTLLSVITKAKPKIGNFAFTTKIPNVGVVKVGFNSFLVADIPGIVENASKGKGLGHRFLRHIERNSVLLFLISSNTKYKKKEYLILLNELKKFNLNLLQKKRLLAISKSDLINHQEKEDIKTIFFKLEEKIVFISSFTKEGLLELIEKLWKLLKN